MKNITIVKTGETFAALREKIGDFEDWIAQAMGVSHENYMVWDVRQPGELPSLSEAGAIVITGSHAMVTQKHAWSETLIEWIQNALKQSVPLLGICYGHQLLARAVGGEVGDNPRGKEFGIVEVNLTDAGRKDPLLGGLGAALDVYVSHTQSVLSLPSQAVVLAHNDHDGFHAFRYGPCAWGTQFHPEFNAFITSFYINAFRESLQGEGKDCDRLVEAVTEQRVGARLLRRFFSLVSSETIGRTKNTLEE